MANPEHLEILRQGVKVWNQWRKDNPRVEPDLMGFHKSSMDLVGIDLSGANLCDVYFFAMNISNANLSGANLLRVEFDNVNLSGADLSNSYLADARLNRVLFNGANLSHADLTGARLIGTDLRSTRLTTTRLLFANFVDSDLTNADLTNAWIGWTTFGENDLSTVEGLDTVAHSGPSVISILTMYRSHGIIPERFLRGTGTPEGFITFSKSFVVSAVDFYTCFISFTESDDVFSERLYNDLQGAGVRCWRWKEDAKWGRTLMRSIDEAVHVYDKLVVICSEASLNSPAVIREIERALQKEDDLARRGEDSEVLFPIRLDDYIFTDWNHYRKADVLAKNIGDFRQWKNPEYYRKSLTRLVRDLKAESPD